MTRRHIDVIFMQGNQGENTNTLQYLIFNAFYAIVMNYIIWFQIQAICCGVT